MKGDVHELVILKCGHWFTEFRPAALAALDPDQERACGHPHCYPETYPAVYFPADMLRWYTRNTKEGTP